ncbi:hypothetical protein D3C71_1776520 [compost metagenome]
MQLKSPWLRRKCRDFAENRIALCSRLTKGEGARTDETYIHLLIARSLIFPRREFLSHCGVASGSAPSRGIPFDETYQNVVPCDPILPSGARARAPSLSY